MKLKPKRFVLCSFVKCGTSKQIEKKKKKKKQATHPNYVYKYDW